MIDEGIKIAETAGGPAALPIIKQLKAANVFVIHKTTTIRHAQSAARFGVDMLSIDGFECAGHPGEEDVGGLVLLALAAKKLDIPYIASGGIGNGRGLAAALMLGACGVNCGTLFMATEESYVHDNIKKAIVEAGPTETTHIFRSLGNTARVYKSVPACRSLQLNCADIPGSQEQSRQRGRRARAPSRRRQVPRAPATRVGRSRQDRLRDR